MIPGEILVAEGEIELNSGRRTVEIEVANTGDRPIQVGSHYHFYETNNALQFDREAARGMRLNINKQLSIRQTDAVARGRAKHVGVGLP